MWIKNISASGNWWISDSERSPINEGSYDSLHVNLSALEAEDNAYKIDFLSNGFKIRHDNSVSNANTNYYIYFALAETPFKYATAK